MIKKTAVFVAILVAVTAAAAGFFLLFQRTQPIEVRIENPSNPTGTSARGKKILAIYSYHPEWGWNIDTEKGIIDGLSARGYQKDKNYELRSFYMDTKVTYTLIGQIQARGDQAIKLIEDYNPDLVFINDDNALTYVAVPYSVKHPESNIPFIFAGINGDPSEFKTVIDSLAKPGHNITGDLERFPFHEAFSLAKRILPTMKTVTLFADASESSNSLIKIMKADGILTDKNLALKVVEIVQVEKFSDWQKKIEEYQKKTDSIGILTYAQLRDDKGEVVDASEVVAWTITHNKLPEIGFLLFHAEDGFWSAVGVSPYKTGKHIANTAADIMTGAKKAGDIPITDPKLVDVAFNIKRSEMLGVKIPLDILGLATQIYTEIKAIRF